MLPYSTLRDFFRIPWVRDNREAVHYLSNMFYLLIALYRSGRMHEYYIVRGLFFEMFDSFAIYGRSQAKNVLEDILSIPWFHKHQIDLYRLIAVFKHITLLHHEAKQNGNAVSLQHETNKAVVEFIKLLKTITSFNHRDESRINDILTRAGLMDALLEDVLSHADVDINKTENQELTW